MLPLPPPLPPVAAASIGCAGSVLALPQCQALGFVGQDLLRVTLNPYPYMVFAVHVPAVRSEHSWHRGYPATPQHHST